MVESLSAVISKLSHLCRQMTISVLLKIMEQIQIVGFLSFQSFPNIHATVQIGEPAPWTGTNGAIPWASQYGWCGGNPQAQNSVWCLFNATSDVSSIDVIWDHIEHPDLQFAFYVMTGRCSSAE